MRTETSMAMHRTRARRGAALRAAPGICCALVLAATLGCEQHHLPVAPNLDRPSAQIVDGANNGGNSHFYFLSPIVRPSPSPGGTLDAGLLPHLAVTICELNAAGQCATVLETFTSQGEGPAKLRIANDERPHFHVNWQTKDYDLNPAADYRITVLAAGTELGRADVDIVNHPRGLAGVAAGSVGVLNGQTLPIKFLVLEGGVFVIGTAGGTITAFGDAVTLVIPANAVSGNTGITIEPVTGLPAAGATFVVGGTENDFGPDGLTFSPPAQLTIAYDEANLPPGREEHELTLLHFVNGSWQGVAGSTVNTTANTVSGPITSFSPYAVGGGTVVTLTGTGTATIDGVIGGAEWAGAGCATFQANLPGGGTTPAQVCVMNDATNLYVSVRYAQASVSGDNLLNLQFDNLDDGRNAGDDGLATQGSVLGGTLVLNFGDIFLKSSASCPSSDNLCQELDDSDGGTIDGSGKFANVGGTSAHEMGHPLNTADNAHDFSVGAGAVVGFDLSLAIGNFATNTSYPAPGDHGHIVIQGVDQQQPTMDASAGFNLAIGGNSEQMLAQVVTAGKSGKLAQVRFPVACSGGFLIVEIQGVTNGVPNGVVLASQSVPAATLSSFFSTLAGFPLIAFTTPAVVAAGQQFAIVLKNTTAGESCGLIPGPIGNPYAGGDGFFDSRPNQAGVWVLLGARADLPFQTVVQ